MHKLLASLAMLVSCTPKSSLEPIADAGPDHLVTIGDTANLDGGLSSDSDGEIKTFTWDLIDIPESSQAILDGEGPAPSLQADALGRYVVQLVVTDNDGNQSAPDFVEIVATTPAQRPTARIEVSGTIALGEALTIDGQASTTHDGASVDDFAFTLAHSPSNSEAAIDSASGGSSTQLTPDVTGLYIVGLSVSDDGLWSTQATTELVVTDAINQAPIADCGGDQVVGLGQIALVDGRASVDPEGSELSFEWQLSPPAESGAVLFDPIAPLARFQADSIGAYTATLSVSDGTLTSAPCSVSIEAIDGEVNQTPIADAGPDLAIESTGIRASLDGTESFDPDGDELSAIWTFSSIPMASSNVDSDIANGDTLFASVVPDANGPYVLTLTVCDSSASCDTDTAIIVVGESENESPIANAGADRIAEAGISFKLDGSGSIDPDGDALEYSWTIVGRPSTSAAILDGPDTESPAFRPDADGLYAIQLTVSDGSLSDSDLTQITVVPEGTNLPPECISIPDQSTDMGVAVDFDASGTYDPNGDELTFSWFTRSAPEGASALWSTPSSESTEFTPDLPGNYTVEVVVSDGSLSCSQTAQVESIDTTPNTPPICDGGGDQTVLIGESVTLNATDSFDADGDPLSYSWSFYSRPSASTVDIDIVSAGVATFLPDVPGVYEVELNVFDGEDGCTEWLVIDVQDPPANTPPICDAGGDQSGTTGESFIIDGGLSSDPDGDALTYLWAIEERPDGSTVDLGSTTGPVTDISPDVDGTYTVRLTVSDGTDQCETTVDIVTTTPNRPPECEAGLDSDVILGEILTLNASGTSDPDGDPLTYQWRVTERPTGSVATIDAVTLRITSFTPDLAGTYTIKIIANDGEAACEDEITVMVVEPNNPPVCDAGIDVEASVDNTVTLDASGTTDPDGDDLVYQWRIIERPDGSTSTIDAVSLRVTTFSPDQPGTYTIRIIVTDGIDECRDDMVLTVTENLPPLCDAGGDLSGVLGETFELNASDTTDPEGSPLTFQWRILERPDGSTATIDAVTLKITEFTPDSEGSYTIRMKATDGTEECREDISVSVTSEPNTPPVCDAGSDSAIDLGDTAVLNASGTSDADGDPLEFLWRIIERPSGSTATIGEVTLKVTEFTPDSAGSYTIRSIVSDGTDECRDDVVVNVGSGGPDDTGDPPPPPDGLVADAGRDLILCDSTEVELDGTDSTGEGLDYSWTFLSVPEASTLSDGDLVDATSPFPSFTPDEEGRYSLQLRVSNDDGSDTDIVAVTLSADGSVVILHLDERGGTDAEDGSPASNDAVITNPSWTGGRFFGGLAFDGGSYITIRDDDSLDLSEAFSIDLWMRTDDVGEGWRAVLTKGTAYNYSIWTYQNELYFYAVTSSGSYVFASGITSTIGDGEWHHYAATVDSDTMSVFVDGELLASEALDEPLLPNTDDLFIGRPAYSSTSDMFLGAIDEVIIREGALTPEEIATISEADTQFCTGDEDREDPDAEIALPASSVETEIGYVKVTGTATDQSAIASVSVNGAVAVPTSDNFADWVAYVPLIEGDNTLEVRVEDVAGNVNEGADDVLVTFNDVCGDDTVLLLSFDESADDLVEDWGPNESSASVTGVSRIIGQHGNALNVSGSGSVTVPNNDDLEGGGPISIELWMQRDGATSDLEVLVAKGDPSTYGMALFGDTLIFGFSEDDGTEWAAFGSGVTDGIWHHVVGVFDGDELALYVDGSLAGATPTLGAIPATNSTDLSVGSYLGLGAALTGSIDQLRIYGDALSASEVVDLLTDGEACALGENLALGAAATATSTLNPLFTADNTIDNDTRESEELDYSMWLGENGRSAWVELDFGDIVGILRVRWANTHNRTYDNRATGDYRIEASATGAFGDESTVIASGTGSLESELRFYTEESSPVAARYLRFYADSFEGLGPGLNEIQVYGLE